ncbi:MAG TPA: DUF3267 domain-containing protein [Anaerolineales bacterium]|nr:DUF3267 domain-containing protein [Anaerolineales bacterium]
MKPVHDLPEHYHPHYRLDLSKKGPALLLNLAALPLLLLFYWLFQLAAASLRPAYALTGGTFTGADAIQGLLILIAAYCVMIIAHELIHGLFFWLFTQERPLFGFKGLYAYAAAPRWHIPRSQYVFVGLGPFVLISLLALLLIAFVPIAAIHYLVITAALNASGAVGDLFVVAWILRYPPEALVRDSGDAFEVFVASEAAP